MLQKAFLGWPQRITCFRSPGAFCVTPSRFFLLIRQPGYSHPARQTGAHPERQFVFSTASGFHVLIGDLILRHGKPRTSIRNGPDNFLNMAIRYASFSVFAHQQNDRFDCRSLILINVSRLNHNIPFIWVARHCSPGVLS